MKDHVPWSQQTWVFSRRQFQQLRRNKMMLFLIVGWPTIWYFLTVTFLIEAPEGELGYIKAANGINYGLFGAFTVTVAMFAGSFSRDIDDGRYQKLRSIPVSPTADLTGRLITGSAVGCACYGFTIAVAFLHGATFRTPDIVMIGVLFLTLLLFSIIAMALSMVLAVAIKKPEHMTTIAVVVVLMTFFLTGYNGVAPELIAENATIVNYLPNSLATRMQIAAWSGPENVGFMNPPEAPYSGRYGAILGSYAAVLATASAVLVARVGYRRN